MGENTDEIRDGLSAKAVRKEIEKFHVLGKDEYLRKASEYLDVKGSLDSRSYNLRTKYGLMPMKVIARMAFARNNKSSSAYGSVYYAEVVKDLGFICQHTPNTKTADSLVPENKQYYASLSRPQQSKFRALLVKEGKARCAFTGCQVLDALEAAHIVPKVNEGVDSADNGFLLRADVHKLFDAELISVAPKSGKLRFDDRISSYYRTELFTEIDLSEGQAQSLKKRKKLHRPT